MPVLDTVPKLFQPVDVGPCALKHRIVMAPLTRFHSGPDHIAYPSVKDYYAERGSTPGTLLIAEGVFISPHTGGYDNVPGIWTEEQIAAWKEVTDKVHENGSFIFLQLWVLGRTAFPQKLRESDPSFAYLGASDIPFAGRDGTPSPMNHEQIKDYCQTFADGASNAVNRAGFDGVEIHGANGYIIDQFLQDVANNRTDEYGGSVANRSRFGLEVVDAVVKAVGEERTAIRLSPWHEFQQMRMKDNADIKAQFGDFVTRLRDAHPNLAYLHLVEPRLRGMELVDALPDDEDNDFLREIWAPRPFISAGGYKRDNGMAVAEEKGDLIAYGRGFISNPDLVELIKHNKPWKSWNRGKFYLIGHTKGYFPDWAYGSLVSNT